MSLTVTEHQTDGRTVTFPFQFAGTGKGYISISDIHVEMRINDVWTEVQSGWSLSGTNQITFITPPAASPVINLRIRRIVDKTQPYATFGRGIALDMQSLNNTFIQLMSAVQELLDGYWSSDSFFFKEDVRMGNHRMTELAPGLELTDAVNKGQLDAAIKLQDDWNKAQDVQIAGILSSFDSGVAHRTTPWTYTATGGETELEPPFDFTSCLVFINGVAQNQLSGAFRITDNKVKLSEALLAGDDVMVLIGSRVAAPTDVVNTREVTLTEGMTTYNIGTQVSAVEIFLDGLHQKAGAFNFTGNGLVTFTEPVPDCDMTIRFVTSTVLSQKLKGR